MSSTPTAVTRCVRVIANLCLAAVMLASAAFLLPSLFGFERYVITGGSMSGTFERGSVAFEKLVPVADLGVGDVITYLPPADSGITTLVTHRIVKQRPAEDGGMVFRTKGDANEDIDPWTFQLHSAAQPRVEMTVPLIGYLFLALAERDLRVLVVGVPAGLIAVFSLMELLRALRPDRRTAAAAAAAAADLASRQTQHAPHPLGA